MSIRQTMKPFLTAGLFLMLVRIGLAQTNVTVGLTNRCLFDGTLVSQTGSNLVLSLGGELKSIRRSEISWMTVRVTAAPAAPSAAQGELSPAEGQAVLSQLQGTLKGNQKDPWAVLDQYQKMLASNSAAGPAGGSLNTVASASTGTAPAESEADLRAELKSPAGQALLQQIHDALIGSEKDPRAQKASAYYFQTMKAFADGKIGLADIQAQSQQMLGKLKEYRKEMEQDPQHERWATYQQFLEQFSHQPLE